MFCRCRKFAQQNIVRKVSDLQLPSCGTLFQIILDNATTKKRDGYLEWNDYFMAIAFLSAQRSKDPKTQVGACIVNEEKKIVGIGYNGMPNGCNDDVMPWGREGDSVLETKQLYVCHAELNAVLNKNSADVKNCTVYVALFPCNECAKVVIQSGIKEVIYYSDKYYDRPAFQASKRMFDLAGVRYRQYIPKQKQILIDFETIEQMSSGIIADMDSMNLSPRQSPQSTMKSPQSTMSFSPRQSPQSTTNS